MIAVASADQGGQSGAAGGGIAEIGDIRPGRAGQSAQAGIDAAERLEAAEQTASLVLGENLRDAELCGEFAKIEERRRRIGWRQRQQLAGYFLWGLTRKSAHVHRAILARLDDF